MAIVFCLDDDADLIRTSSHGMMSNDDLRFFRDRMDTAMRAAGSGASDYLRSAYDNLRSFNLDRLRDRVEAVRDKFTKRWDEDRVTRLSDVVDFQNAKPTNRRYIMAIPRLRKLWQEGRADGYGGAYDDEEPGAIGRNHTPYREMMNGVYVEGKDGEDTFVTYLGVDDADGEQVLSGQRRQDCRVNIETMAEILDRGKRDPSSKTGKTL